MAVPSIVGVSSKGTGTTGAAACAWPTHQTDDIGIAFVETNDGATTLSVAAGWAALPNLPQSTTGTKLWGYWKRATSAAEANWTVDITAGTENHIVTAMAVVRGCITTGDPWDVSAGTTDTSSDTSGNPTAVTTTVAECLVLFGGSSSIDTNTSQATGTPTGANLANVAYVLSTNALSVSTNTGDGGGIVFAKGEKATAGDTGALSVTYATASLKGLYTIALKPPAAGDSETHSQPDTFAATDAQTKAAGATKADTASVTDARTQAWAAQRTQADTLAATDAVAKASALTLADALSVTDAQAKAPALAPADTASVTDAQARVWAAERTQADAASVTDAADPQAGGGATDFTQPVDDTASATDALAKSLTLSLADAASVTDATAPVSATARVISDTAAVTDAVNTGGSSAYTQAVDDALAATDAVGKALTLTFTESLTATDAIVGKAITQAHAEQLAATDTLVSEAVVLRSLADSLAATDETGRTLGSARWDVESETRWGEDAQARWGEDTDNHWATTAEENW